MHICRLCLNSRLFTDQKLIETEVLLDLRGAVAHADEPVLVSENLVCGVCGASSEDGCIVDAETGEPVTSAREGDSDE